MFQNRRPRASRRHNDEDALPDVLSIDGFFPATSLCHCQRAFEGTVPPYTVPPSLCLQRDGIPAEPAPFLTSFDVDSILAFADDFAFVRREVKVFLEYYPHLNVTSDVHLTIDVPAHLISNDIVADTPPYPVRLDQIPHLPFGQLEGFDNMLVYVFFPQLYRPVQAPRRAPRRRRPRKSETAKLLTTLLTKAQYTQWYDDVFIPALYASTAQPGPNHTSRVDTNYMAYFPKSRQAALAATKARAETAKTRVAYEDSDDEQGVANAFAGYQGKQIVSHAVPARYLQRLSQEMRRIVGGDRALAAFHGFVIYFAAKNTKHSYIASVPGDDPSAVDSQFRAVAAAFEARWAAAIDEDHLASDRVFLDVAKQHAPVQEPGSAPRTLLWRRCCHEDYVDLHHQWVARRAGVDVPDAGSNDPDGHHVRRWSRWFNHNRRRGVASTKPYVAHRYPLPCKPQTALFPFAMLWDSSAVTITPTPKGPEYADGFRYTQLYNVCKAPFDAQRTYPFTGQVLDALAFDDNYLRSITQGARAKTQPLAAAKQAYLATKRRIALALDDAAQTSYGTRQEHRVSLALFRSLVARWPATAEPLWPDGQAQERPWFDLPSEHVFGLVRAQVNRYCYMIEALRATSGPLIGQERSTLLHLLIRALQYTYGSGNFYHRNQLLFGTFWRVRQRRRAARNQPGRRPPPQGRRTHDARRTPSPPAAAAPHEQPSADASDADVASDRSASGSEANDADDADQDSQAESVDGATSDNGSANDSGSVLSGPQESTEESASEWVDSEPPSPRSTPAPRPPPQRATPAVDRHAWTLESSDSDIEILYSQQIHPAQRTAQPANPAFRAATPLRSRSPSRGNPVLDALRRRDEEDTRREGLGIYTSMAMYGVGWWQRGKLDWTTWTLNAHVVQSFALRSVRYGGAAAFHKQGAVRAVEAAVTLASSARDVLRQLPPTTPGTAQHRATTQLWQTTLACMVLRRFDCDVWAAVHERHGRGPRTVELTPDAVRQYGPEQPPLFCWDAFRLLFCDRAYSAEAPALPEFLTGHRAAYTTTADLLERLFGQGGDVRRGWDDKPYRMLLRILLDTITTTVGADAATAWYSHLLGLAALTHWVLPNPSKTFGFLNQTDALLKRQNKRLLWYSSTFCQYEQDRGATFQEVDGVPGEQGPARAEGLNVGTALRDRLRAYVPNRTPQPPAHGDRTSLAADVLHDPAFQRAMRLHLCAGKPMHFAASPTSTPQNAYGWYFGSNYVEAGLPPRIREMDAVSQHPTTIQDWFAHELQRVLQRAQ